MYMKIKSLLLSACFFAAALSPSALALTINDQVTPAYVGEHPKEWSVKVTKGEDGLIHFTIQHDVEKPKYHVAHLAVYHQGKLIATSDTPSFGKKQGNTFYFSLDMEDITESKFDLSDGDVSGSGDDAIPMLGLTMIHHFRLLDFVPEQIAKPATGG
jgi:predicted SnoaL-like aldol condensation-catalyzing enzyme